MEPFALRLLTPVPSPSFGVCWCLLFLWCLDVGAWSFSSVPIRGYKSAYFFACVAIHKIQSPSPGVGNCAVVSVITATAALVSPVRGLNHRISGEGGNA